MLSSPSLTAEDDTDHAISPPSLRPVRRPLHNLPSHLSSFIGRERELEEITRLLLSSVRLLTLTGPGGTGKTRLTQQVGWTTLLINLDTSNTATSRPASRIPHPFPDGIFFVNLAPLKDAGLVASAIAQALDIRESAEQSLAQRLADSLGDRALLLILDNFEHVLDAAPLVGDLLAACPNLSVLVTSRAPLHLRGEQEYPVAPLPLPMADGTWQIVETGQPSTLHPPLSALAKFASVQLFVERARAVRPDFALTDENATAVAEICTRLDGLPLAIELAAGRIKALTPQAILQRLTSRLRLLTGGSRDLPARQQTLRSAIDWSYDLLTTEEKTLFRRLAVFVGGRPLTAIEAVCDVDGDLGIDVVDGLTSLVDKSLVRSSETPDGETYYPMLVTLHEYALERLTESGEIDRLRQRHADYYLRLASVAEAKLRGPDQLIWLDRLEREADNIRAVLHWFQATGQVEAGLRLVGALEGFWYRHSHPTEGRAWAETMLALDHERSADGTTVPPSRLHARAKALSCLGSMIYLQGYYQQSNDCHAAALALFQMVGDRHGEAMGYNHLGVHAIHLGHDDQALPYLQTGLAISQTHGDAWVTAALQGNVAYAAIGRGDFQQAEVALAEELALLRQINDRLLMGHTLVNLCEVRRARGKFDEAGEFASQSLALARECQDKELLSFSLHNLAHVALKQARYADAAQRFLEGVALGRSMGSQSVIASSIAGLASVAELIGQLDVATQLVGSADALLSDLHANLSFLEDAELVRTRSTLRNRLGDTAFDAAWAIGGALTVEQAVSLAHRVVKVAAQSVAQTQTLALPRAQEMGEPEAPATPLQAAKVNYGGLTAREREVAVFIAQGLTNDEIAERMSVVVKTVEKHVGNVLGKLGFENRAQIAAWAVDRGLATPPQDIETQWRKG